MVNKQRGTRREFLSVAASVGLGVAASPSRVAAGEFSGKIRKALKYHMIDAGDTVEDRFRIAKDIGFDGIETRIALGDKNKPLVDSYRRASEKVGLPIHGTIHSSNPTVVEAISQAKSLGANSVLHVVRYNRKISYLQNYRETQDIIRRATDAADKHDIMILCENVWASYLIEPMGMARFIDEIDHPLVGIYFDVGNVVRWGWPEHWLEVIGKRAKKLDIKEFDLNIAMKQGMKAAFGVPLGEGSIDWKKVRQQLTNIDYRGWATAEVKGGDEKRLAEIASQMDRVLDLA